MVDLRPKIDFSLPGFRPAVRPGLGGLEPGKKSFGRKSEFFELFSGPEVWPKRRFRRFGPKFMGEIGAGAGRPPRNPGRNRETRKSIFGPRFALQHRGYSLISTPYTPCRWPTAPKSVETTSLDSLGHPQAPPGPPSPPSDRLSRWVRWSPQPRFAPTQGPHLGDGVCVGADLARFAIAT